MLEVRTEKTPAIRLLLLPLASFFAVLPLILHGCSCGHDFDFHLQSWLDAAWQIRGGMLYPHWTYSAAWNAGEPRFIFYPPLSWMLGALLTLVFPFSATPVIYTWIALTAAAFAMYRTARAFTSGNAALLAATLYIYNPYMLFTAYERTAYGELLAAVWLPFLLLAAIQPSLRVVRIAVPIALLWLTNAPAAVMGCYMFAVTIALRVMSSARGTSRENHLGSLKTISSAALGLALGLALSAFYLVPAAYQRRYVQIAMAIIPNMRFQDNFLFGHTADVPHNVVLHTVSVIAILMLALTVMVLLVDYRYARTRFYAGPSRLNPPSSRRIDSSSFLLIVLTTLTLLLAFLLTPLSTPLWNHLPELAFLQFPWRFLSILGAVFALGAALLFERAKLRYIPTVLAVVCVALTLSEAETHAFRQGCELFDRPATRAELFNTQHGVEATDEYTPVDADNDVARTDNPPYWATTDPNSFAPGTTPNPAATIVNYDTPPPLEQTVSHTAPAHFTVHAEKAEYLVLHLRDYPNWNVAVANNGSTNVEHPPHVLRDDGLIAIAIPAGDNTLNITWQRTLDQTLGDILSLGAFCAFVLLSFRERSQHPTHVN